LATTFRLLHKGHTAKNNVSDFLLEDLTQLIHAIIITSIFFVLNLVEDALEAMQFAKRSLPLP
jgi:hypothetical protein